jgi:hypothetical protein
MRLSRKKAIELCIEAWTIHAETGCTKDELPEKHQEINNSCWFCEYGDRQEKRYASTNTKKSCCNYCPLWKIFKPDGCYDKNCYYLRWSRAKTSRTRKKYAGLFLAQIKELR